jgi:murein DD-endopeptidase MepM/ murein hydrolase activator NlpD
MLSTADMQFGTDLANNRGKLPWPVNGIVSIPFGEYTVEGTSIRGRNPGITISTSDKDVPVKCVFDGVVSDVDERGEVASIFIRHGKYYTVYSNLSGINVSKGTIVKKGEIIVTVGDAYEAPGGELTFLLMVEENNVNPANWLTRQ